MPKPEVINRSAQTEHMADLCRRSESPAVLYGVPGFHPIACSRPFTETVSPLGLPGQGAEWAQIEPVLAAAAGSGLPAEMEVAAALPLALPLRLHFAPIQGPQGVEAVLAWFSGPGLASQEVRHAATQAAESRSRFLAAASHDLRQPFQAMRFFHSVLADHLVSAPARRASDMLGAALTSGEQLLTALLDISTLEAGTVTVKAEKFRLDDLVERLLDEYAHQATAKGLRIRARLRPLSVLSDPILVERIVRNLVVNAIQYTRKGGVLLAVRLKEEGCARFDVWDTGFGIPEDQIGAIFEEFHQLENPERDRARGLGLGLAIVRRLSRLLGAPVDVRSRLGRGSVFSLTLPLAVNSTRRVESMSENPANIGDATVLVVDDDAMVLMGLQMILESWGLKVLAAEDMAQVLQRMDEDEPDLVLSDLRLRGGLSGFDVVERVRAMLRKELPAIILTGETGKLELSEGQKRSLTFLHKPVQADPLRNAIGTALARA